MNKQQASVFAEIVTLEDLKQMFRNAQKYIADWTVVSRVNKGMSKGAAYNILAFEPNHYSSIEEISKLAKINMIWEFGEYLPDYKKQVKKTRAGKTTVVHQDPKFKL